MAAVAQMTLEEIRAGLGWRKQLDKLFVVVGLLIMLACLAILAILSFVFLFAEMFGQAIAGVGVGVAVSVPLATAISALEIIVVLVQAYVFTLLSAVFIGMAIHVHH